jgi:hypothetical protein
LLVTEVRGNFLLGSIVNVEYVTDNLAGLDEEADFVAHADEVG